MAAAMMVMAQSAMAQDVTTVFEESFAAFTEGSEDAPATTDISTGTTNKLNTTLSGWSGRYVYEAGGSLKLADGGYLQTARYDMKANKGIIKVSMRVRSLAAAGAMYAVYVNSTTSAKVTDYVFDNQWHEVSYVVSGASTYSTTYIRIGATMAEAGILVDDLKVEQSASFYPAPVAKQPTQADGTSFTAKWDYISGSTGYYLDVYSKDENGAKQYVLQNQFISGAYSSSYKVTGLNEFETYYFVVRATNGTATSENSNEIQVVRVITSLDAPEALPASEVGENYFQAEWNDVENADGFVLDVQRVAKLKADKNVVLAKEDFSFLFEGTVQSPVYPALQEYLDEYTYDKGWYAYGHLYAQGLLGLAPFSSNPATLTSPMLSLASNGGKFTVKARMGATSAGVYTAGEVITINLYDGETLVESKQVTLAEGLNDYTVEFTKGTAQSYVEFSYASTTKRAWIDELEINQDKKAGEEIVSNFLSAQLGKLFTYRVYGSFDEGVCYRYSVRAFVNTVVGGALDKLYSPSSNVIEVSKEEPSSVDDVTAAKTVASVRYYDLAGRAIDAPAQGISIAVTTYTDGTTSSAKVMK